MELGDDSSLRAGVTYLDMKAEATANGPSTDLDLDPREGPAAGAGSTAAEAAAVAVAVTAATLCQRPSLPLPSTWCTTQGEEAPGERAAVAV